MAALDRKLRYETRRELIGIQERVGTAFLIVTHDQEEALGMATRIAVMNQGHIAQIGAPAEIYERPRTRFVADFVGEMNWFEGNTGVRPEKLMLSLARPVGFAVPARVTAVDYQGGVSIIRLDDRANRGLVAVVASAAARQFARGAAVWASWQPDDAVVIRR
jgi:ABC-type Fe3+/spermidine/putrescine transport system ATPase subunit